MYIRLVAALLTVSLVQARRTSCTSTQKPRRTTGTQTRRPGWPKSTSGASVVLPATNSRPGA
jgi:hypothetical protein